MLLAKVLYSPEMRLMVGLIGTQGPLRLAALKSPVDVLRFYSSPPLMKNNWKQDTVYLYQFPRSPVMPNLSPFCLKVETFLRVNDIKYEVIGSYRQRSTRGLLPFIELNGRQIADSQVIIWELQKHFKLEVSALLQDKSVLNGPSFMSRSVSGLPLPAFATNWMAKRFSETIRKRVDGVLGRLSRDELRELLRRDIRAIDDVLQDKKFLFGGKMTVTDCAVFAQLAVTYYLPYRQLITDLLDDEFPRVRHYVQRIRNHYYPEWKED
ncbi:hypothetical protein TELCIR_03714 [Teladorsagia circumcincta]|uniref:Glutathione S-transferase protein n=1 Tax=Teladorsagia circumcincta TaxID=45464 RepID=A0A2G9UVT1_TELCI|nr:hypothetical protein TELCIR_03714 [Teladorsagia circumcincta]